MSTAQRQDQIRYCERCGISFLWSAEEQRPAPPPSAAPTDVENEPDASANDVNSSEATVDETTERETTVRETTVRDNGTSHPTNGAHALSKSATPAIKNTPPTHCPGCRILLPPPDRERGLVKWYNRRKRFGFIIRRDHPEIFAHGSELQDAGSLRPGDLVEFTIVETERGLAAQSIHILARGEAPILD